MFIIRRISAFNNAALTNNCIFPIKGFSMATSAGAVSQFFEAIQENQVNQVREFLKNKIVEVDVRDETSNNQTALHVAAKEGHSDLVRMLVDEFGAPVNIQNGDGEIPLQEATDSYQMKVVKFLLERNSELRDYAESYLNEPIVDELMKAAELNQTEKVVELVKDRKVDVNSVDKSQHNRTALHVAASNGYDNLVRVLVDDLHADIQFEDDFGETAKNNAIDNEHPEIAQFLIERGYKERV